MCRFEIKIKDRFFVVIIGSRSEDKKRVVCKKICRQGIWKDRIAWLEENGAWIRVLMEMINPTRKGLLQRGNLFIFLIENSSLLLINFAYKLEYGVLMNFSVRPKYAHLTHITADFDLLNMCIFVFSLDFITLVL